jgi:AcrR family transcriptional regulator
MPAKKAMTKPAKRRPERRPDSRREEIIAATIRVIGEHGVAGASMRAIAREMGLTTGVISHHFVDKGEVLREALQTCFDPWLAALEQGKKIDNSWDRFRQLFCATVSSHVDHKNAMRVWLGLLMQIERERELWQVYKARYGWMREEVRGLFGQCQRDGYISAGLDPDVETDRIFALCDGLMVSRIGEPERFTDDHVNRILLAHVDALRTHPSERRRSAAERE